MTWEAVGAFTLAAVTLAGLNVGALRWVLERREKAVDRNTARWEEIERGFYELRAQLPIEYVRREDWIRFSSTLDAKLDAMRVEMRDDITDLKDRFE